MLIGELAARTGASRRSLRYYEQRGLLVAARTDNGYRHYDEAAVSTVARIRALLAGGLGLDAIRTVLPCTVDDGPTVQACEPVVSALRSQLTRLDAEMAASRAARDRVADMLATAAPEGTT